MHHKCSILQSLPLKEAIPALSDLGLPPEYQEIVRLDKKQRLESLALLFGVLALKSLQETPSVIKNPIPDDPKITRFYGSSYCMHTRAGCLAISKWQKEIPALKDLPKATMHEILFRVETGLLQKQARFSFSEELERSALYMNWASRFELDELMRVAKASLPRLHEIRREYA